MATMRSFKTYGFFQRPAWLVAVTFGLVYGTAAAVGYLIAIGRDMATFRARPALDVQRAGDWYVAQRDGFEYSLSFVDASPSGRRTARSVDWLGASAECRNRSARLVHIADSDEQSFVLSFIYDAATAHGVPVPGKDRRALSFWTSGAVHVERDVLVLNRWPFKRLVWRSTGERMTYHHFCKFTPDEVYREAHVFALMFDLYDDPHRYLGCWMPVDPAKSKYFPLCKAAL